MRKEIECEFRGRTEYKEKITLNQVTFSHSFNDGAQQKKEAE